IKELEEEIQRFKVLEASRLENEERFSSILNMFEDQYFEMDLKGNFTFFNKSLLENSGVTREQLTGMNYNKFMDEANAKKVFEVFNKAYHSGKPYKVEFWIETADSKTKNNQKRYMESSVNIISDDSGEKIGFRGFIRDISDRYKAETDLQKSESRFREIIENMEEAYSECDLLGNFTYANNSTLKTMGYTEEEYIGKNYTEHVPSAIAEMLFSIYNKVYRTGEQAFIEGYEMISKDGSTKIIETWVSLILDNSAKPIGFRNLSRDITLTKKESEEKKQLEEQFHQAQKLESIGTLAGGVAHDFNNLLMSMQGNLSILLYKMDDKHPHRKKLKLIEQQIQSGAELTRQLLGFARGGKYQAKATDMNELIEKTVHMFARTRKELKLFTKFEKDIDTVVVDRGQMEQVLLNLFVNAWQAMPDGGNIYIRTESMNLDKNFIESHSLETGKYIKISITDTGIGMNDETVNRIFDPFFTTKEVGRGTGLGLASVYGIVKNHNGVINVSSEEGIGSTFEIYLPSSKIQVTKEIIPREKAIRGNETVLIVDDEDRVLEVSKGMLETLGYQVIIARTGEESIEIYNKYYDIVDIVLLDIVMHGMDGGEVFDHLKQIHPNVKVLLSSGYSEDEYAADILKKGANGFIQKPFTIELISQKIRQIIDSIN
ncbi:MAG: PAS domain S-box protein, partial [Desulfobacterales bacterium]|nr:PAS domain S-box protein [Desulfobacterales bacterium]